MRTYHLYLLNHQPFYAYTILTHFGRSLPTIKQSKQIIHSSEQFTIIQCMNLAANITHNLISQNASNDNIQII